jgi:hypothetical protein
MRTYPCSIIGVGFEGRADYIAQRVEPGDDIELRREPDNPHDSEAVAAYHDGRLIGYVPRTKRWVSRSLDEGDDIEAIVTGLNYADDQQLVSIAIDVTIRSDGPGHKAESPPALQRITPPPKSPLAPETLPFAAGWTADGKPKPAKQRGWVRALTVLGIILASVYFYNSGRAPTSPAPQARDKAAELCGNNPKQFSNVLDYYTNNGMIREREGKRLIVNGPLWIESDRKIKISIAVSFYCDPKGNRGRESIFIRDHRNADQLASVIDGNYWD